MEYVVTVRSFGIVETQVRVQAESSAEAEDRAVDVVRRDPSDLHWTAREALRWTVLEARPGTLASENYGPCSSG